MRRTLPAAALLAALAATLVAADPPTADPGKLVTRLGSPVFAEREAAAKALDALGEAALPALKKALAESTDAELTERAGDLYLKITRRAENARLVAPTRVELDLADAATVDALAALEKQSGYKFFLPTDTAPAARAKKVTVRTGGKVPFWEAVDRVCGAAGLRVVGSGPPQVDPRYSRLETVRGGDFPRAAVPAGGAFPGFVPAVPEAPAGDTKADGAEKKAAEKQAAREKAAKEFEGFWGAIEKKAAQAVQPGAPPAAAPAASPAVGGVAGAALVRTRPAAPPGAAATPFAVLLATAPAAGPRGPVAGDSAVRIEAVPPPAESRPAHPADTLLAVLQATPEPKLGLEQVTEVRVTRAVAAGGKEVVANKLSPAGYPAGQYVEQLGARQLGARRLIIVNGQAVEETTRLTTAPAARQGLVRLKAPEGGPVSKLAELSGVLVGTVRTSPAEVVAVPDLYPKAGPSTYRGHAGATLRAAVTDENIDDTYTLDVALAYSYTRVSPAVGNRDEALISDALAKARAAAPGGGGVRSAGVLFMGLVLTDAAGTPFRLTTSTMRTSITTQDGERVYVRTMRVTASPTRADQGKPAKLGFYGTWLKPVQVPFTLTDVPVAAGALTK